MIKKLLCFIFLFALIFSSILLAGTTGKISGKIIDAESKEPLPGVNVVVEGTALGAATDINGFYMINNIPPGTYVLNITAVGYQKKQIVNVKVAVDFTTKIDVEISSQAITTQTVVIEAKTPLIRTDLTSSQTTVDASQIETLPVESVTQILTLQAGVTQGAGGELHIRGGRSNEIQYTVNGISIANPFDFTKTVQIATNAIQELSVVSGTFNAEYGNALSGIVNTVTKEGGEKFKGHVSFYTGDFVSSRDDIFDNINDFNPFSDRVSEFTLGGPIPFSNRMLSFFVSGRLDESEGYLYGKKEHTIYDSVYINNNDPNDIRVSSTGDGSWLAMNPSREISGTAKITFKPITAMKINFDVLYSKAWSKGYSHDFKYVPESNYNYYEEGQMYSIELRHAIDQNTFYTLRGFYNFNDYKQFQFPLVDAGGNAVDYYAGKGLDGLYPSSDYQPDHKLVRPTTYTFYFGGTRNYQAYERTNTFGGKLDFTSQLSNNHELKFGLEGKTHKLELESFSVLRDSVRYLKPYIPPTTTAYHDLYAGDNAKKPVEFSAYVQDKIEYENFIMNLGVRYDYFYSKAKYSVNTTYPSPNDPSLPTYVDKSTLLTEANAKHQISPRLGISFPITDRGIIHFSYGHFFQMPPFQYLYTNPEFKSSLSSGDPLYGNANLNPEKTVTYELGLQQQLMDDLAFNITGYFKDVKDLLATQTIRVSGEKTYQKYVNKDYGNIKGVTFSLTKRRTQESNFGVTLDYTFQVSEGNDVDADAFFIDLSSGRQSEKVVIFLPWDQSHNLNSTVSFGGDSWNVSLVGRIGTGLPYTPTNTGKQVSLRTNSDRKPIQTKVDLFAEKSFTMFDLDLVIFFKVFNLFDTLNERYVYEDTGRATYTLQLMEGGAKSNNELAAKIPGIHTSEEYFRIPSYYSAPREILAGISIEF